jgi:hypothetical protein
MHQNSDKEQFARHNSPYRRLHLKIILSVKNPDTNEDLIPKCSTTKKILRKF